MLVADKGEPHTVTLSHIKIIAVVIIKIMYVFQAYHSSTMNVSSRS